MYSPYTLMTTPLKGVCVHGDKIIAKTGGRMTEGTISFYVSRTPRCRLQSPPGGLFLKGNK